MYLVNGKILTNNPTTYNIENTIQVFASNNNLVVSDAVVLKGKLVCLVFDTALIEYHFYDFNITDLSTPNLATASSLVSGVDNQPYLYSDGNLLYMTNNDNGTIQDNNFKCYSYDENTSVISGVSFVILDAVFVKTTNAFITGDFLFTFVNGDLNKFDLTSGARTFVGFYDIVNGVVFKHNSETYFSNGSTAVKWNI